jgi:hypothetical protein
VHLTRRYLEIICIARELGLLVMRRRPTERAGGADIDQPKKRVAPNGNKLPAPIREGEVLTDITKNQWKLGRSIGVGGFGEIYLGK